MTRSLRCWSIALLLVVLAAPGAHAAGTLRSLLGGGRPFLRMSFASERVVSIRHCTDGYAVATADGRTRQFWEFNVRFKTDSSAHGPPLGTPFLMESGMQGDRVYVIFSTPQEITGFIRESCGA